MDANATTATDSGVAETAEATIAAVASSEAVNGFPIEPIKILGRKAYPLEETLLYFTTLRSAYDTLQSEHTEVSDEHAAQAAELERERQQVLTLRLELKEAADKLEVATAEKDTAQNEVARVARAAQQKDMLLGTKEADIKQMEVDLAGKIASISRHVDEIAELKKKNAKLEESNKQSISRLEHNTMRQQLEGKIERLKAQKDELEEDAKNSISLAELEEKMLQPEAEIAALKAVIEVKKETEEKNTEEMAAQAAKIADQDLVLANKAAEITALTNELAAKDAEIASQAEEIIAKDAEIERLAEHQYEIVEGAEIMVLDNDTTLIPAEFGHKIVNIFGPAQIAANNYVLEVKAQMDALLANAANEANEKIATAQRQHDEILQSAQAQAEELISEATIDADAKRQKADTVLSKARENAAQIVSDAEFRAGEEKAAAQNELETIEGLIASASARYQKLNAQKAPALESGAQELLG